MKTNPPSVKAGYRPDHRSTTFSSVVYRLCYSSSPAARGGNLAKIPPNQVIADFGRGSSVESESE